MNKILFWGGAIVVLVAAVFGLYVLFAPDSSNPSSTQDPTSFPSSDPALPGGSATGVINGIPIETYDGQNVFTNDFIHNGETVADVQNPGAHVLAGTVGYCLADGTCPTGASVTDYQIAYNEQTHFFNIVLLKEPLGATRLAAEQFLQSRLGLAKNDLCALNYFVGTPYWINEYFANKNLGFSFCPGATVLP